LILIGLIRWGRPIRLGLLRTDGATFGVLIEVQYQGTVQIKRRTRVFQGGE